MELEASTASIRQGRRWVTERAREHGVAEATLPVLELLTSELVTNAVRHGPGSGSITVCFRAESALVAVEVRDASTARPVERTPKPDEAGGRGIQLVRRLAHDWGVRVDGDGKWVWFRMSRRAVVTPAGRRARTSPAV